MRIVIVTAPKKEAAAIGAKVVEERLAACVNILPAVRSVYVWKGKVEDDEEAMMLFKTTESKVAALTARIMALHSYEVPEVITLNVNENEGNPAYLAWVSATVAGDAEG
jgi:periplasmic divalent cation tolerance protein